MDSGLFKNYPAVAKQNSRSDLDRVWPFQLSKIPLKAGLKVEFREFCPAQGGKKWPEDGMRKREAIFSESSVRDLPFMKASGRPPQYIAVEGPIGVGKTSLVKLLAVELQGRDIYEEVEENPFLTRFYQDQKKHAFQTQIFFLFSRFQQQMELLQQDLFSRVTISDYLFEKDKIFAYLNLDNDELELYEKIYKILSPRLRRPDLVIYLQAGTDILLQRIRNRSKPYEKGITVDYIEELNRAYNQFFFHYDETPLLVISTAGVDFIQNPEEVTQLIREIQAARRGMQYYIPRTSR
jgi:deoxyadenosine/deoxycytidine kinase